MAVGWVSIWPPREPYSRPMSAAHHTCNDWASECLRTRLHRGFGRKVVYCGLAVVDRSLETMRTSADRNDYVVCRSRGQLQDTARVPLTWGVKNAYYTYSVNPRCWTKSSSVSVSVSKPCREKLQSGPAPASEFCQFCLGFWSKASMWRWRAL